MKTTHSPVLKHATRALILTLAFGLPCKTKAADHALTFTNSTHLVTTTGMVTSASFTYEAWFKITTFAGENQVVAQYANHAGRLIVGAKNTKAWFFIGGTSLDGVATLPSNTWTHIAVTRSNSTAKLYINGTLDKSSTSFNTNSLPLTGITIGGLSSLNFGFKGQIAEVRAWNTELTEAQIQARKDSRLAGNEANLVGYWRLDEGLGGITLDHCGSAHGSISGASWAYGVNLPVSTTDPSGSWSSATGGDWSDVAKWEGGAPAQGVNGSAYFTNTASAIAIANDLSPLPLGRILLSNAGGVAFTGNAITLTNQTVDSLIACTNGTHTLSAPLAVNASRLILETRPGSALVLSSAVSGHGGVFANPAAAGEGTVTLSGANTFAGPVLLGSGTLAVGALADAGSASVFGASSSDPANLMLGPGTLRLAGPASSTDRGYTTAPGGGRASLISVDTNAAFGGTITALSGAFIKRGKGTLSLAGLGSNVLSVAQAGNMNAFAEYPANGDSPVNGFGGFNVAEGTLTLGVPGQTNHINGEAWVGLRTTGLAGKEVTGDLEINGGYTRMNSYFVIGRDNGTTSTAPAPLQPSFTLMDGTLSLYNLIVTYGNDANHNTRAVMNIQGGLLDVDNEFRLGDQRGNAAAPAYATVNVYGGTLRHAHASQGITFGWRDPGCSGALNLFGGLVDEAYRVKMGQYGSTSRLNLHGGVLRAQNIVQNNPNANIGQSHLYWNGGVFQPNAEGQTLAGLTSATVSTNGAIFDTSLADFTVRQDLLHDAALGASADGGLVKLGTNTLTFASYGSTYSGTTAVSNGTLLIASTLPAASALVVAPNAEAVIGGSATQTVSAANLALDSAGTLSFAFALDGSSNDRLALAASPSLAGRRLALYCLNTRAAFSKSGTYTLMTYGGTDPDTTGLVCANPVIGKLYTFAAAGGALTVTVGADPTAVSVWNVDGAGNWADAGNWTLTAPSNGPGSIARLDSVITAPVTVTTAGETVGSIFLNNLNAYTLGGSGLTLNNNAESAVLNVELGAHTIVAPLTLAGDAVADLAPATVLSLGAVNGLTSTLTAQGNGTLLLTESPAVQSLALNNGELAFSDTMTLTTPVELQRTVSFRPAMSTTGIVESVVAGTGGLAKNGSNVLSLAANNTYTGVTRIDGGTIVADTLANGGQPCSIGAASAANGNLLLGPATLRYTGPSATIDRGYTLNPGSNRSAVLFTENDLTFAGKIQSTSGALIKTGPGSLAFTYPGLQALGVYENTMSGPTLSGPFGDSPTTNFQALTILNGKVVVGVPGQTNTVGARMCVGYFTTTSPGAETAGELEINNGAFTCNSTVSVGRNNGNTTTAPGGLTSRITVNGGAVTLSLLALGYNGISGYNNFNARPACDVNAGTLTINNYCNVGESVGATAALNVNGGTVRVNGKHANGQAGILLGGPASAGNGTLNISGTGVVYCANNVALCTAANATGTLSLNGGTLTASNIVRHTTGTAVLRFNGGTFQPTTHGLTLTNLTAAYVSTNGVLFETSLANGYTVAQNLLHEPALGAAKDGGLVKLGTNSLSLAGTGNTFNGLVDVRNGLLRARLGGTNDLNVAPAAAFDALGERATVGNLTGGGPLTNGVIALTGALDAGTNNAPAGAKMTVQNLSMVAGSTFACDWSTNALGIVTNDLVAVTGTLSAEGPGFVDFGSTEARPIPMPFRTTIMTYGSFTGSFLGWKAVNSGLSSGKSPALVMTAANGLVKVEVRYVGTVLMLK